MSIPRSARALVTVFTLVALAFCYTTGAVLAAQAAYSHEDIATAVAACHALDQDGHPENVPSSACDQYLSDNYKPPSIAAAASADSAFAFHALRRTVVATPRYVYSACAGASPPLRLLHCRFLN
jgi:hypothetical protein